MTHETFQNVNVLFIIILVLYIWRIGKGSRDGFIAEVGVLADICIVSFMVADLVTAVDSIIDKEIVSFLTSAAVFLIILIARKVIRAVFCLLKWIAKLPLLNSLNQLFGLLAGAFEATVIVWAFYTFLPDLKTFLPGDVVMKQVTENTFLNYLYLHNELGTLVQTVSHLLVQKK